MKPAGPRGGRVVALVDRKPQTTTAGEARAGGSGGCVPREDTASKGEGGPKAAKHA